jgi:hypothetical protein
MARTPQVEEREPVARASKVSEIEKEEMCQPTQQRRSTSKYTSWLYPSVQACRVCHLYHRKNSMPTGSLGKGKHCSFGLQRDPLSGPSGQHAPPALGHLLA